MKGKYLTIEERLDSSLSYESKQKIEGILDDVNSLSNVEKLCLYLKLPPNDDDKRLAHMSSHTGSNRTEQAQAYTWIKSHLEEDNDICLPKQDVYKDYELFCENHSLRPLNTADFGKLMKSVFPNVKPRRLGQRGQSKYCYGGLRKKLDVQPPVLPDLDITKGPSTEDKDLIKASCQIVCEWAQKLLPEDFKSTNIRLLAEYLVTKMYINSESVAAFTLIASLPESSLLHLRGTSIFSNSCSGDRHRETQLQLQRKLQEKEQLKELKKKVQQQKEESEQKLRESRQTPFLPSPTPNNISPVRRIFDKVDFERAQSSLSSNEFSQLRDAEMMSCPVKTTRSKSAVHFDIPAATENKTCLNSAPSEKATMGDNSVQNMEVGESEKNVNIVLNMVARNDSRMDTSEDKMDTEFNCSSEPLSSTPQLVRLQPVNSHADVVQQMLIPVCVNGLSRAESRQDIANNCSIASEMLGFQANTNSPANGAFHVQTSSQIDGNLAQNTINNIQGSFPAPVVLDHPLVNVQKECSQNSSAVKSPTNSVIVLNSHTTPEPGSCPNTSPRISSTAFTWPSKGMSSQSSEIKSPKGINVRPQTLGDFGSKSNVEPKSFHTILKPAPKISVNNSPSSSTSSPQENTPPSTREKNPGPDARTEIPLVMTCGGEKSTSSSPLVQPSINRSAFVPFSQVQGKGSFIAVEQGAYPQAITNVINNSQMLQPLPNCRPDLTMSPQGFIQIPPTGSTVLLESPVKSSSVVPIGEDSGVVAPPMSSISMVLPSTVGSISNASGMGLLQDGSSTQMQASPTTPKKSKCRYAPIRPKESPVKTVSNILKEQKVASECGYDKSKPVSALLKEKRAREAEASNAKPSVNVNVSPLAGMGPSSFQLSSQGIQIHNLSNIASNGKPGEFFIIVNQPLPALTTPTSATSENVTSVATGIITTTSTITTSSATGCQQSDGPTLSTATRSLFRNPSQPRSRTNSSSELEIQSILPPSKELSSNFTLPVQSSTPAEAVMCTKSRDASFEEEMPSKLLRMESKDANPLSRPGSRCSSDRETPSFGRKRKFHNNIESKHFKRMNSTDEIDEDIVTLLPREMEVSKCSVEKAQQNVLNCPDISVLEIDALSEPDQDHHLPVASLKTSRAKHVQSDAVAKEDLLLRESQQQLLKQKEQLDKRMKNWENNLHHNSNDRKFTERMEQVRSASSCERNPHSSVFKELQVPITEVSSLSMASPVYNCHGTDPRPHSSMDTDSDMPDDVADFINDSIIGSSKRSGAFPASANTAVLEKNRKMSKSVDLSQQVRIFDDIVMQTASLAKGNKPNTFVDKMKESEQKKADNSNFISPQRPARRQRTPSVEKVLMGNNIPQPVEAQVHTTVSFASPLNPAVQRKREPSVERNSSQTPISDPGYGSIGASPVMSSISSLPLCDMSMNSSGVMMSRPDSVQSLASDTIQPSPVPPFSPRHYSSTPLPIRSPCPTPNRNALLSPIIPGTQGIKAFMPIQTLVEQNNGNVTLIKPVVTVASTLSEKPSSTQPLGTRPDKPPSYKASVQYLKKFLKEGSGAFCSPSISVSNIPVDKNAGLLVAGVNRDGEILNAPPRLTPGEVTNDRMETHFPCSKQLMSISKKLTARKDLNIKSISAPVAAEVLFPNHAFDPPNLYSHEEEEEESINNFNKGPFPSPDGFDTCIEVGILNDDQGPEVNGNKGLTRSDQCRDLPVPFMGPGPNLMDSYMPGGQEKLMFDSPMEAEDNEPSDALGKTLNDLKDVFNEDNFQISRY